MKWADISSYSQGDKDRVPHTFEARAAAVRIIVTRRHGLSGWFLRCEPWHDLKSLGECTASEAKEAALEQVRADVLRLTEALDPKQ